MYEPRHHQPIATPRFVRRIVLHVSSAVGLVAGSLLIGMIGYVYFEHFTWIDAFVNASMLLGGMGPVNPLQTDAGKLFAGFYALYAGLVFLAVAGLLLAPFVHRLLHRFHWESDQG
jgi:flagellar biosynthesis protein FliR